MCDGADKSLRCRGSTAEPAYQWKAMTLTEPGISHQVVAHMLKARYGEATAVPELQASRLSQVLGC